MTYEVSGANSQLAIGNNGISGNVIVQNNGALTVKSGGIVYGYALAGGGLQASDDLRIAGPYGGAGSVVVEAGGQLDAALIGDDSTLTVGSAAPGAAQASVGWIKTSGATTINDSIVSTSLAEDFSNRNPGANPQSMYNGALQVSGNKTTVTDSTISADSATLLAHGVVVQADNVTPGANPSFIELDMKDTKVSGNIDGMFVQDDAGPNDVPILVNVTGTTQAQSSFTANAGAAVDVRRNAAAGAAWNINIDNSTLTGGAGVTATSSQAGPTNMTFTRTAITANTTAPGNTRARGVGVYTAGNVNVTLDNGTTVSGNTTPVTGVTNQADGLAVDSLSGVTLAPTIVIKGGSSIIGGVNGAAIHVLDRSNASPAAANITISGGSTLQAGSGNTRIIQVDTGGRANVSTDTVNLTGDVSASGANAQLQLDAGAGSIITGTFSADTAAALTLTATNATLNGNVNADGAGTTAAIGVLSSGVLNGNVTATNGTTLAVSGDGAGGMVNGAINASGASPTTINLSNTAQVTGPITIDGSTATINLASGAQALGGLALKNGATGTQVVVDGAGSLLSNGGNTAISVDGTGTTANIYLQNGGRLDAAAGNPLVNVTNAALANVTLDNTTQAGDLTQDATSKLNVTLQNNATLTGNLATSALAVNSGSTWRVGNQISQSVGDLSMNGGTIDFNSGTGPFKIVTASSLNGSGNLNMGVDFKPGASNDQLNIDGQANGSFGINANAQDQGVEDPRNNIPMVFTQGGNAQFAILADGGKVDAGIYTYTLQKAGDDWVLVRSGTQPVPPPDPTNPAAPIPTPTPTSTPTGEPTPTPAPAPLPAPEDLSPAAKTALSMSAALPYAFYGELGTLRQRQGDLRMNKTDSGLWARSYSTFNQIAKSAAPPFQLNQYGGSLGADKRFLLSSGDLYVGGFGSYSYNTLDIDGGSTGRINSYGGGAYATWMLSNGWYLDSVLKANNFDNELRVVGSSGSNARGKYSTPGFGGSIELGKHIDIGNNGFIEPYMQWAGFVAKSASETLDNNFRAHYGTAKSVQGQIGMLVGNNFEFKNGVIVQPYIKGAVIREFINNNRVTLNGTEFTQDMSGNRMLVGLGVATQLKPNLQIHLDTDYSTGGPINNSTNINFGVRYAF
ncbi:autotransporter outer membrane beta-barrel domain-containing protein [Bordetella sp. N]|uniref:autotransporter outer membrane beta-barrel domain-containing protein n=1 Tax=Bordetella sp. N TaxID=1746199 RepID=UPI00070D4EB0|nr:autotransporter outer membrane beta-barrel domain-containing protein [Bordetella sp. N]ALM84693.1 hypothetical protein ASB57_18445 [Bordetella sp. N]